MSAMSDVSPALEASDLRVWRGYYRLPYHFREPGREDEAEVAEDGGRLGAAPGGRQHLEGGPVRHGDDVREVKDQVKSIADVFNHPGLAQVELKKVSLHVKDMVAVELQMLAAPSPKTVNYLHVIAFGH